MTCHPTRILRDEHQRILAVVDALIGLVDQGRETVPTLRRCVTFFRLYTDALHHGKEEDLLFGSLEERGFSRHSGPIAMMLHEHQVGRALVKQMEEAIDAIEEDAEAWRAFDNAARSYAGLLHRHIEKEDHGLFDMADSAFDEPACRRLCEEYDRVCARRFGGHTVAELERVAAEIVDATS